jgi:cyclopropane fatty-acyl-phospholipid synthase-like methyltransferase
VGSGRGMSIIVSEYIKPYDGMRILDVGCGPADILHHINNDVYYYGFDLDPSYIKKAQDKFGNRGHFICQSVNDFDFSPLEEKFDRIVITGVLHHLDDNEIIKLFSVLKNLLKPDGYLIAVENTFVGDQSMLANIIISLDRGQNVRTPQGYIALIKDFFKNTSYSIRHDLLNIPYTHIIITCRN